MRRLVAQISIQIVAASACASSWTVDDDGPADFDNIQAAVDASISGDEIIVSPGVYTGTGEEVVDLKGKAITVRSSDGPEVTTLDGEHERRGFSAWRGESLSTRIDGFSITNGLGAYGPGGLGGGGGILCHSSSPTIIDCIITNSTCVEGAYGGAIACMTGSSPLVSQCVMQQNVNAFSSDSWSGVGGIWCWDNSSPTIEHCVISNNTGAGAGGIQWMYNCNPVISSCWISQNTGVCICLGQAGGIAADTDGSGLVSDSVICANLPDQVSGDYQDGGNNAISESCPACQGDIDSDLSVGLSDLELLLSS